MSTARHDAVSHQTSCACTAAASPAQDVMFAFDRSKLKDWVADIKELIKRDLRGIPGWGAHTR